MDTESIPLQEKTPVRRAWPLRIWRFYIDGFKSMTIGRYLWAIILIKLAILFLVFKLFFFPNILEERYDTDAERADAVRHHLTDSRILLIPEIHSNRKKISW